MNSKIIRISILIIVMLFFAGLFNSVFAIELDSELYEIKYTLGVDYKKNNITIGSYPIEYPKLTSSNIADGAFPENKINDDYYGEVISHIDESSKLYAINFKYPALYCLVFPYNYKFDEFSRDMFWYETSAGYYLTIGNLSKFGSSITSSKNHNGLIMYYDFNLKNWYFSHIDDSFCNMDGTCNFIDFDLGVKIYDGEPSTKNNLIFDSSNFDNEPSINLNTVRTGTSTGYVEFTPKNWDSHMYYVKGDINELQSLIDSEELSVTHSKVKLYNGPVDVETGDYVLALLFDNSNLIFHKISEELTLNYDDITDKSHSLHLDKDNEDTYYLSIHGYQDGDYVEVSKYSRTDDFYVNDMQVLDTSVGFEYNGLQIGSLFENALGHRNRKIKLNKNGITYFNLYDKDGNFINTCVLNSSNYYSGEDFNFDVDLSFGNNKFDTDHKGLLSFLNDYFKVVSATEVLSKYNHTSWVKVKPTIDVPSLSNYELYVRIFDYGTINYIDEEDRNIFTSHDNLLSNNIGCGIGLNSNTDWHRIDNLINDYFYIATLQDIDANFTFELQLRSKSNQVLETKTFNVILSASNSRGGLISSATDGKNDTYVRDSSELAGGSLNSNNFNFDGLNSATDLNSLKNNLSGMLDNSIGFFSLLSTFLLLLPTWVSSLIYFFLFGIIVITLYRFVRGA